MNHRPFEDWLLDDQPLDPHEQRELQNHLRGCVACSAIAESNLALHGTHLIGPEPGFTDRFAVRLARRRVEQRWRQTAGTIVLVLAGLAFTLVAAGPSLQEVLSSPASWIAAVVGYFLFIVTSMRVIGEAGTILMRVVPNVLSPAGWVFVVAAFGGLCLLWGYSIRRLGHTPQGV